jgi:hypothetical protein
MTRLPETPGAPLPPPEEIVRRNRRRLRPISIPMWWIMLASAIALVFAACHLAGLREDVSMVFGTGEHATTAGALGGAAYATFYLSTVIICPILVIGAGIRAIMTRLLDRQKPSA